MKKYIIGALVGMGMLSSCSDFLDREPFGKLSENSFYQNLQHATYAANSCYTPLANLNGFWATGVLMFGNMCSDDASQNSSINSAYTRGAFDPGDYYMVTGTFEYAYKGIARCNVGIEKVSQMTDDQIDPEDKKAIIGEMKFIRGFWYYHLIRLFGDVPVILKPVVLSDETTLLPARTPVDQIIKDVIIPDLTFAAENLPETRSGVDVSRATKGAAHAFLTAVHMLSKNYAAAITEGEKVVALANKGVYELLPDLESIYREENEFNKENIFEVSFSKDKINWASHYFGTPYGGFCRGQHYITHIHPSADLRDSFSLIDGNSIKEDPNKLYNKDEFWKNRDPRFDITFYTPLDKTTHKATGEPITFSSDMVLNKEVGVDFQKFTIWYGPEQSNIGINNILMRYANVLLYLSEAYTQTGNLEKGAEYLNLVRTRARNYALAHPDKYNQAGLSAEKVLPNVTFNNAEEGMKFIRSERRAEFAGENYRGYDLRRWGIEESTWAKVQGFSWDTKMSLLPIPSSEMNVNPNLTQNPGY